jgi:uncharacterized LabA/DUF88 family protein
MDRVTVFVDAGYLFAQGSALLFGQRRPRGDLHLDYDAILQALERLAGELSGLPLLRIYWYDGTSTGPSPQHQALAFKANVKVRLGFVNTAGEQKGVDSLIVSDMIDLARHRAMADALLFSGDEDLRVGVQQAQQYGVRVHLLGVKPSRGSQSLFLLQEADTTHEWTESEVSRFLSLREFFVQETPAQVEPTSSDPLLSVALEVAADIPLDDLEAFIEALRLSRSVPKEIDARLLAKARNASGAQQLDSDQKRRLRELFRGACDKRLADQKRQAEPGEPDSAH